MTEGRREQVLKALPGLGCDALLVTKLVDVRYLTGFSGSNAALFLSADVLSLATDGRYTEQAQRQVPNAQVHTTRALVEVLVARAAELNLQRLGIERANLSLDESDRVEQACVAAGIEIVDVALLDELRRSKDAEEIEHLRQACSVTVRAWEQLLAEGVLGRSELDLAGRLEHLFRVFGAEDRAFPSIVAAGAHSAIPHHEPTSRLVQSGDFLKIDCGARIAGYHADFTRTVVVGPAQDWQLEIHASVLKAQAAAAAAATPGIGCDELDRVARSSIESDGFGEHFVHPVGHGVGLEIHERPILGRSGGILRPQMALTLEPGIYLPGRGGVRIEDTFLMTDSGLDNLTDADRGLISV